MAVHHFTAVGIESSRGWQAMTTFPRDGTVVEVQDEDDSVVKAQWRDDRIWSERTISHPKHWRYEEG